LEEKLAMSTVCEIASNIIEAGIKSGLLCTGFAGNGSHYSMETNDEQNQEMKS
jgi:hypothetical protein